MTLPWGTPLVTGDHLEEVPRTTTICLLFDMIRNQQSNSTPYLSIQFRQRFMIVKSCVSHDLLLLKPYNLIVSNTT